MVSGVVGSLDDRQEPGLDYHTPLEAQTAKEDVLEAIIVSLILFF